MEYTVTRLHLASDGGGHAHKFPNLENGLAWVLDDAHALLTELSYQWAIKQDGDTITMTPTIAIEGSQIFLSYTLQQTG